MRSASTAVRDPNSAFLLTFIREHFGPNSLLPKIRSSGVIDHCDEVPIAVQYVVHFRAHPSKPEHSTAFCRARPANHFSYLACGELAGELLAMAMRILQDWQTIALPQCKSSEVNP